MNAHMMTGGVEKLCLEQDREVYPRWMLEKYGQDAMDQLRREALGHQSYMSADAQLELAADLTKKILQLQKEKHKI